MAKNDQSSPSDNKPPEQVEISFFSFRFKCSGPTSKTIIILLLWLVFFALLIILLPGTVITRWLSG